jgi:hypothetical protein
LGNTCFAGAALQAVFCTLENANIDLEEHEQEEQLEYGANAADIAADKMAAIVAQQCDQ